ncbi:MAG: hypothetical protein WB615_00120 [Candidatus Tumulicola sp.]
MQRFAVRRGRLFEAVVWIVAGIAACYLIAGAYYGYVVGRTMHESKASNPMIAMVAGAIGRNASEQFAIVKLKVPDYIVKAPTFWVALRLNE